MIRQYGVVFVAGAMAAVLQTTVFGFLTGGLQVDLIFAIVVVVGLFKPPVHGSIMSAGLGLGQDIIAGTMHGTFMAARLSIFIVAQALKGRLSPESPVSQFVIALGLGLFDKVVIYTLQGIFSQPLPISGRTFGLMLAGIVINAALVPGIYFFFCAIPGFVEMPRGPRVSG